MLLSTHRAQEGPIPEHDLVPNVHRRNSGLGLTSVLPACFLPLCALQTKQNCCLGPRDNPALSPSGCPPPAPSSLSPLWRSLGLPSVQWALTGWSWVISSAGPWLSSPGESPRKWTRPVPSLLPTPIASHKMASPRDTQNGGDLPPGASWGWGWGRRGNVAAFWSVRPFPSVLFFLKSLKFKKQLLLPSLHPVACHVGWLEESPSLLLFPPLQAGLAARQ